MSLMKSISGLRGTIGGKVGENLTPIDVVKFSAAFATFLKKENNKTQLTLVVGRDGRSTGHIVNNLVTATLQNMGVTVLDIGYTTTPTIEMCITQQHADGGIMITASHNPMNWNALKLLNEKGEFISGANAKILLEIAENDDYIFCSIAELGSYLRYTNAIHDHINAILQLPLIDVEAIKKANFSVIMDVINSTGAIALPFLMEKLGIKKIQLLHGSMNGQFAHNPEPLPENLTCIANEMKTNHYDVGFVVDPDVDRLAIMMENGDMFGEEFTLVAVADYILQHQKGNAVSNLSSTRALRDVTEWHGSLCFQSAVGEVNVVEKMKSVNAVIGGEGNGGVIYPDLHYGRDALVGIALFLTYMAKSGKSCSEIRKIYPHYVISKNKIELQKDVDINQIFDNISKHYDANQINREDGIKIDFKEGWVHLRPSNTEPILRIYAEAHNQQSAEALIAQMKNYF
ncbi:MAG: phosphoglucosamine mutase [Bacteroidales bacterium]|jgi:phosphomannomutase|nr:phosphoglucosamine mutase [Bacteroidales bacterium]